MDDHAFDPDHLRGRCLASESNASSVSAIARARFAASFRSLLATWRPGPAAQIVAGTCRLPRFRPTAKDCVLNEHSCRRPAFGRREAASAGPPRPS